MGNTRKVKYKIKPGLGPELYEMYGDRVIEKQELNKNITISTKNNNFVILMQMTVNLRNKLIEEIGFTYFGYLSVLIDTLDYSNKVNFNVLKEYGVSYPMIKLVRKKLKDVNIVKKYGNDFLLNPGIAKKGDSLPDYVINLFDK